ncbi:MAG: alpha/beta hydrolase [Pseudomonadota bacterium]|nr:alpha/beta hydrolase [Pseudomonadota bacterium]
MIRLLKIISFFSFIYVLICLWLYLEQRNILYKSRPEVVSLKTPYFWLDVKNAKLKIWEIISTGTDAIIYFGGNAEPIDRNINTYQNWLNGKNIYLMNYRGSGGSTGKPSEIALCSDAVELFDYLEKKHDRISAIGRSLGTGVASCLASKRDIHKLALITPFDSILSVAENIYSVFPVKFLLKDTFDSMEYAKTIYAEVLILIASKDQIIPPYHGYRLANAFKTNQVNVHTVDGANHRNISKFPKYADLLREFFR